MPRFPSAPILAALVFAVAFASPPAARAADIVVVANAERADRHSVSFAALRTDGSPAAREMLATLRNDLALSGWFVPVDQPAASVVLSGAIRASSAGVSYGVEASWNLQASRRSWNGATGSRPTPTDALRDEAHALADRIVREVLGKEPMASSKILCVGRVRGATDIYECDADGRRLRRIMQEGKLCLSPNWEPGRNAFLYTAWTAKRPVAYEVDLSSVPYRRRAVSSHPGMNQGATLSPDGRRAAIVLSRSGGVDLYLIDPASPPPGRILERLTSSRGANEASPSWSPDGRRLAYASDEGSGYPRCRVMDVASRRSTLLVQDRSIRDSAAPEWSAEGRIAFCGRQGARYRIFVADPDANPWSTHPREVSPQDGTDYEDPSWAPDGRHVVCTRTAGYRRSLVVLDTAEKNPDPPRVLFSHEGDWFLPSWSANGIASSVR